jgi:hypothetical protein
MQVSEKVEKIPRLRVTFWAKHAHEAFGILAG